MGQRSAAAQRIVDVAMRLFGEKGYAATSVGDIEAAAGLTPRASGLYRHFRSKRAVLEAGIADQLDAMEELRRVDTPVDAGESELRDWATLMARVGLVQLGHQAPLIRILYRDLHAFPDLLESTKERLIRAGYRDFAGRLRAAAKAGRLPDGDFEAVAAVAVGAVVNYGVFLAILGEPPGGVDEDRFVAAWVDMVLGLLGPAGPVGPAGALGAGN
jgi:AcrR family transcriptional regulator